MPVRVDGTIEGAVTLADAKAAMLVPLGTLTQKHLGTHPAPGGHLTTDAGIQDGIPAPTTGLRWVPWNELDDDLRPIFNYQCQNPVTAPAAINATAAAAIPGATAMANVTGSRKYGFGALSAEYINGTQNIRFDTDSLRVIPVWVNYNGYTGSSYHDMHMLVQGADGTMQHLSDGVANNGLPRTASTGGGVKRRELTFSDRRMKKQRVILSGFGHFMGVYIDTNAEIRRTANKPGFMGGIDSWWEPNGASWNLTGGGSGYGGSSYQCIGLPEAISFHLGLPCGTHGEGGSGWKMANGVTAGEDPAYATDGTTSCQASDVRMASLVAKFSGQYLIHYLPASWNDGSSLGTPYQTTYRTRMTVGLSKMIAYSALLGRDIRFITGTIQPVDRAVGDFRDLSDVGVAEIPAIYPNHCLGMTRLRSMWKDTTYPSGSRAIYCHSNPSSAYIHLWSYPGNTSVAGYLAEHWSQLAVPLDYLQKAVAA